MEKILSWTGGVKRIILGINSKYFYVCQGKKVEGRGWNRNSQFIYPQLINHHTFKILSYLESRNTSLYHDSWTFVMTPCSCCHVFCSDSGIIIWFHPPPGLRIRADIDQSRIRPPEKRLQSSKKNLIPNKSETGCSDRIRQNRIRNSGLHFNPNATYLHIFSIIWKQFCSSQQSRCGSVF